MSYVYICFYRTRELVLQFYKQLLESINHTFFCIVFLDLCLESWQWKNQRKLVMKLEGMLLVPQRITKGKTKN